jgi:hypothetical protein
VGVKGLFQIAQQMVEPRWHAFFVWP